MVRRIQCPGGEGRAGPLVRASGGLTAATKRGDTRLVLFRFPDRASVKAFYEDPEYQDLLALRHRVAETRIVVVDGL